MQLSLEKITKYINEKLEYEEDCIKCIEQLKEFIKYLENLDEIIEIDKYLISDILSKNTKLNSILEEIVENNLYRIITNDLEYLINDEYMIKFIETYCDINDIKINESNEKISNKNSLKILEEYKKKIKKKRINLEEEKKLIEKAKNNDIKARNELLERNLILVVYMVKKYSDLDIDIMDLVGEGNLGLIKSIEKYEIEKNKGFASYAIYWVYCYIQDYLEKNNKTVDTLENYDEEKYIDNYAVDITKDIILKKDINQIFECLTEREARVLKLRFGFYNNYPMTLEEIAKIEKLSEEGVRKIQERALNKIRNKTVIERFATYMDNPKESLKKIKQYRESKQY